MNAFYQTLSSANVSIHNNTIEFPIQQYPQIFISEKEYLELKCEVGFWRSLHQRAILREQNLKQIIKEREGQIRDLKSRVFGKQNERTGKDKGKIKPDKSKRPRGQQHGSKGHGRTKRPDLPEQEEEANFSQAPICPDCCKPYILDESLEAEIIEVQVKAYTRKIKRCVMKKSCSCTGVANTVTAPMPPKLFNRSPYGISIWEAVLLSKFQYCQPTNRLLNQYQELGLPISPGTIAGGLKKIKELFQPVYDALYNHQMTEDRFHNDESSWKVFENIEGKIGNRWWLWVSRSASVVYFQITPGRGADVPVEYFQNIKKKKVIVICDRYSAYKSLSRQLPFIILAFCWAHVRRDFLNAARKYPELEEWAFSWVEKFGKLYHINKLRCNEYDPKLLIQWQSASFKKQHDKLIEKMDAIVNERDIFIKTHTPDLNSKLLSDVKYKIMTSLKTHWNGLKVFVEHPEVPMDNNNGENAIRNPVTGRKNFYGSGSLQ